MRNLQILSDTDKEKYEKGLRSLWELVEKNGANTQTHQQAKAKIQDFSRMVWNKMQNMRRQQLAGQQAAGGQPGQQGVGQQNAVMAAQRAAMAGRPAANGTVASAPGASAAKQAPPPLPQHIVQLVSKMQFVAAPGTAPDQVQSEILQLKNKYARTLAAVESKKGVVKHFESILKDRESKGTVPEDEKKRIVERIEADKKSTQEMSGFIKMIEEKQELWKRQHEQLKQGNAGQPATTQAQNPNAIQAGVASVNAAMDAAKNQQLAAANRQQAGAPPTPTTQAPAVGPNTASAGGTPQNQAPAPQPQVKIEPGTQQPHPPLPQPHPVNTSIATAPAVAATANNAARVHNPQAATPNSGAAKPLSHQAAIDRANRQVSANPAPIANQPTSAGVTTTPGSGGLMGNAPQSQTGHPHAHPQLNPSQMPSKVAISKQLHPAATAIPTPVVMTGQSRPTQGGGTGVGSGPISQPVIQKQPGFTFQAEGEHVLSKKKLDELVRQVCGGGPPGRDGNYLTPDVEESVLNVADNFVDNVLASACRLAKERGSKLLEIRDIQLILERVYNIRIPGYTSDELRTVRKAQPSPAWIAKMSAVQAAKVMPGTGDK